jgi:hypothetical protein
MNNILYEIKRQRDRVLDLELHVDAVREQIDIVVQLLRDAVRERDRGVMHLQHLVEIAESAEAA